MKVIKANGNQELLEGAAALVKERTGGDTAFTWHSVGLTWVAWKAKVGGYPTHSGTLLRTERGVFGCGLLGTFLAGNKREDGSIDRSTASFDKHLDTDTEVILEYADPDYGKHGCHRDPGAGAIVCKCPETW